MKRIRGRLGQMRVLKEEISLLPYLPELKLLTESNFYRYVETYENFIIKSTFGPLEIRVSKDDTLLKVESTDEAYLFAEMESAYQFLVKHLLFKKKHIVQAIPSDATFIDYSWITLHRHSRSSSWKIASYTPTDKARVQNRLAQHQSRHMQSLLMNVASKLGEAYPSCHTVVLEVSINRQGAFRITDTTLHDRNSKWSQYHSLSSIQGLQRHIPKTDLSTFQSLFEYLDTYNQVILKPCRGQQGKGIVKISFLGKSQYEIHYCDQKEIVTGYMELFRMLSKNFLWNKDYIVQQQIDLATIDDQPFDVRVIMQLDVSNWMMTGMMAKVAAKGFFISNRPSKLLSVERALIESDCRLFYPDYLFKLDRICRIATVSLLQSNEEMMIIGYDIGIDNLGKIWVIEGNYSPSISMFFMFDNNDMHTRITEVIRKNKNSNRSDKKT